MFTRITHLLKRFFAVTDRLQDRLALKWHEHSNRRTLVILVFAGAFIAYLYVAIIQSPDEFPTGELVSVSAGEPLSSIAKDLQKQGVIRSPLTFRLLMMMSGDHMVRAGDYLFKEPTNVWEVARALSIGAYGLEPIRIRVPEGARVKDMAIIYDAALLRFDPQDFTAKALPLEGHLFPDTYFFLPNATAETVIQTMHQNFEDKTAELAAAFATSTPSFRDIVIIASIIEREASNSHDRHLIAGVVWNRLKKDMPLQMDATFLYTLGKGTFQLTRSDLASDSPYNTYVNKGLPPTPIGSPSLDSIDAAIHPTKSKYLFYLADHNGVTYFSETYAEHARKKLLYLGT